MFPRRAIAVAVVMVMIDAQSLGAADRARFDRVAGVATERYDEWLGAAHADRVAERALTQSVWSSPSSMTLESQVAFALARARFARLPDDDGTQRFLDGVAWHLQSRVVAEVFDLAHHQPGHHALETRLFGDHVRWGLPSLVVSSRARDDRANPAIAHAAAAVATLENVVGWPALAAALRLVASDGPRFHDRDEVAGVLERALGVPLDWFFATLEPAFRINFRLASVEPQTVACGQRSCYRTTISVARDGQPLFPNGDRALTSLIAIRIGFGSEPSSTIWWTGQEATHSFVVESDVAPLDVTIDPDNIVRLDEDWLDQRWRAERANPSAPIRTLAAWLVWLQDATLSYGGLV